MSTVFLESSEGRKSVCAAIAGFKVNQSIDFSGIKMCFSGCVFIS